MVYLTLYADGSKYWRCNQQYHRDNGPAIISIGSHQSWLCHGIPYRLDGPARIWDNGKKEWWFNSNPVSEYEHMFLTKAIHD